MRSPDTNEVTELVTRGSQFLAFRLGDEEYGVEILRVQEIKGYSRITPLPNTPPEMKGVMNLRGSVVPVMDLRIRLGMREAEYNVFTVIIVVTVGTKIVGLVVDAVSDVLNVEPETVAPAPDLGSGVDVSFITGIARIRERLVSLLNIDRLISNVNEPSLSA